MSDYIKLTHSTGGPLFVKPFLVDGAWTRVNKPETEKHPYIGKETITSPGSTEHMVLLGTTSLGIKESPEEVMHLIDDWNAEVGV